MDYDKLAITHNNKSRRVYLVRKGDEPFPDDIAVRGFNVNGFGGKTVQEIISIMKNVTSFSIHSISIHPDDLREIMEELITNTTITHFGACSMYGCHPDPKQIVRLFQHNTTLQSITSYLSLYSWSKELMPLTLTSQIYAPTIVDDMDKLLWWCDVVESSGEWYPTSVYEACKEHILNFKYPEHLISGAYDRAIRLQNSLLSPN